jgi:ATP-binding cassette subfamily B protein
VDPTNGQVLIDGNDIRTINLEAYRNQSGVVPQEVFLFSDTIANNIGFGIKDGSVTPEEIEDSAIKAHVYHNIVAFPDKFETILGERGVNLSGGQKQRLSIARALLRKPKLLVLDDCLSAVDTETEEVILTNLKEGTSERTSLIVSHRISSLRNATKIIVIDHGKMVEEGTHDELINSGGLYAEMYQKQLAEEKE